jgi:CYTH domain-containing protein
MPNNIEIEKRFLIKKLPNLHGLKFKRTIDVYFPEITDHARLRARHQGGVFEMTKKTRKNTNNGYIMEEQTINLLEDEFTFLASCSQRRIVKNRYYYPYRNIVIEIDVFEDKLEGLMIAEIEFKSEEDLENFIAPDWLGKEINNIEILAGGVLSGKTYDEIKNNLV